MHIDNQITILSQVIPNANEILNVPKHNLHIFQDIGSDWDSELGPARTDTYLSPRDEFERLDLIDLTLSRNVSLFELEIHAGVFGMREMFRKQCFEMWDTICSV